MEVYASRLLHDNSALKGGEELMVSGLVHLRGVQGQVCSSHWTAQGASLSAGFTDGPETCDIVSLRAASGLIST